MGLLERHGPDGHSIVRTKHVASRRRHTLAPVVRQNVTPGSEVFSDALGSYRGLKADFIHGVIDHAEKYVEGQIHTAAHDSRTGRYSSALSPNVDATASWHARTFCGTPRW